MKMLTWTWWCLNDNGFTICKTDSASHKPRPEAFKYSFLQYCSAAHFLVGILIERFWLWEDNSRWTQVLIVRKSGLQVLPLEETVSQDRPSATTVYGTRIFLKLRSLWFWESLGAQMSTRWSRLSRLGRSGNQSWPGSLALAPGYSRARCSLVMPVPNLEARLSQPRQIPCPLSAAKHLQDQSFALLSLARSLQNTKKGVGVSSV